MVDLHATHRRGRARAEPMVRLRTHALPRYSWRMDRDLRLGHDVCLPAFRGASGPSRIEHPFALGILGPRRRRTMDAALRQLPCDGSRSSNDLGARRLLPVAHHARERR